MMQDIIDELCDVLEAKKVLVTSDRQEIQGIEEHHHRDNQSNDKCDRVCTIGSLIPSSLYLKKGQHCVKRDQGSILRYFL